MGSPEADEIKATVNEIAAALQESKTRLLFNVVQELGPAGARAFLAQALAVEAQGGMLTVDGKRRRTPGGIFFRLIKEEVPEEVRLRLFPPKDWRKLRAKKKEAAQERAPAPASSAPPPFAWADRHPFVARLLESRETGRAESVKLTLIGRVGKVIEQGEYVMMAMQGAGHVPSLPKGVPHPPESRLLYLVYITQKQWKRVAAELERPNHVLIVDGHPTWDRALKRLVVLAQSVRAQEVKAREGKDARRPGIATTLKQFLVGTPGPVVEQGQGVLLAMRGTGRSPSLPRGLPELPGNSLTYLVYIGARQWRRIAAEMEQPGATLAVEGLPLYDSELKKMAMLAVQVRLVERRARPEVAAVRS